MIVEVSGIIDNLSTRVLLAPVLKLKVIIEINLPIWNNQTEGDQ